MAECNDDKAAIVLGAYLGETEDDEEEADKEQPACSKGVVSYFSSLQWRSRRRKRLTSRFRHPERPPTCSRGKRRLRTASSPPRQLFTDTTVRGRRQGLLAVTLLR